MELVEEQTVGRKQVGIRMEMKERQHGMDAFGG